MLCQAKDALSCGSRYVCLILKSGTNLESLDCKDRYRFSHTVLHLNSFMVL